MPTSDAALRRRRATFWHTCIPVRAVLAASMTAASVADVRWLQLLFAAFMGWWAASFVANFVRKQVQEPQLVAQLAAPADDAERARAEAALYDVRHGGFGGVVWWQWPRLAHAACLGTYAILVVARHPYAYVPALVDVALAIAFGAAHFAYGCAC